MRWGVGGGVRATVWHSVLGLSAAAVAEAAAAAAAAAAAVVTAAAQQCQHQAGPGIQRAILSSCSSSPAKNRMPLLRIARCSLQRAEVGYCCSIASPLETNSAAVAVLAAVDGCCGGGCTFAAAAAATA